MKHLLTTALLILSLSCTVSAQEEPPVEFVYDLYQFCIDSADEESPQRDAEVLSCVNEDLVHNQYRTFESLSAVLKYIEGYGEQDQSSPRFSW